MSYPEPKDPQTGKARKHQEAASKNKGNDISNAEVKPSVVHLDPGNYDGDTLRSIWNPILERRGWEITDINDGDFDEMIITLESQEASDSMTSEDLEYNDELIKELEDTEAFQGISININDTAYISLECELYPENEWFKSMSLQCR